MKNNNAFVKRSLWLKRGILPKTRRIYSNSIRNFWCSSWVEEIISSWRSFPQSSCATHPTPYPNFQSLWFSPPSRTNGFSVKGNILEEAHAFLLSFYSAPTSPPPPHWFQLALQYSLAGGGGQFRRQQQTWASSNFFPLIYCTLQYCSGRLKSNLQVKYENNEKLKGCYNKKFIM